MALVLHLLGVCGWRITLPLPLFRVRVCGVWCVWCRVLSVCVFLRVCALCVRWRGVCGSYVRGPSYVAW